MKFISSSDNIENVDKKDSIEILFNKVGRPTDGNNELVFGKTISVDLGSGQNQIKYFILVYNSQPYDPYGTDSHREQNLRLELKSVSQKTYNYYLSYLKTKNSLYMTRAQRSFIDG
jgi:hypothetical protein